MKILQQENINDQTSAIHQTNKHHDRSDKYNHVNSLDLISRLEHHGFQLVGASTAKTRKADLKGFEKHVMVFSRDDLKIDNENNMNLMLTNSHDGRSSLKFNIGVYRTVCANGLVVGDDLFQRSVNHLQATTENIDQNIIELTEIAPSIFEKVSNMRSTSVKDIDLGEMMADSLIARFGKEKIILPPADIFKPQRLGDFGDDIYTYYNIVQEKMIRGGFRYRDVDIDLMRKGDRDAIRTKTAQPIRSITTSQQINKDLWKTWAA